MRKSFASYHEPNPDEGAVNLTPLIDVVFVVLILFILIAPLLEIDRIALAPAAQVKKDELPPIQENAPIKIHVYADNSIWLNGTPISEKDLFSTLKQVKLLSPTAIPQIYHDREAYFGTYQVVKNSIEAAGFEEMDVILKPSS